MIIGGIWHGAGFTFLIWGIMHGIFLCINHMSRYIKIVINKNVSWLITFLSVSISWVVFRAENIGNAWEIISSMFGLRNFSFESSHISNIEFYVIFIIIFIFWLKNAPNTRQLAITRKTSYLVSGFCSVILYLSILNFNEVTEFIYFQF